MKTGCRIVMELDVSVDELLEIQKTWKASDMGSLEQYTLLLLRGKVAEFKAKKLPEPVT